MDAERDERLRRCVRELTLVTGRHRWHLSCPEGSEPALLAAVIRAARRGEGGLDLTDAAMLARRLMPARKS